MQTHARYHANPRRNIHYHKRLLWWLDLNLHTNTTLDLLHFRFSSNKISQFRSSTAVKVSIGLCKERKLKRPNSEVTETGNARN